MHKASQKGHCGVVRMLLEAKADVYIKDIVSDTIYILYIVCVHHQDNDVSTGYMHACNYYFAVNFPSSLTAHIPTIQDGRTAYDVASRNGHTQVFDELLH